MSFKPGLINANLTQMEAERYVFCWMYAVSPALLDTCHLSVLSRLTGACKQKLEKGVETQFLWQDELVSVVRFVMECLDGLQTAPLSD